MECLWRLFCHWPPDGHRHQQDPAVLYVHIHPYDGFSDHHLHGIGFLEKYEEIYLGCEA